MRTVITGIRPLEQLYWKPVNSRNLIDLLHEIVTQRSLIKLSPPESLHIVISFEPSSGNSKHRQRKGSKHTSFGKERRKAP
jgi:hypothetical protein